MMALTQLKESVEKMPVGRIREAVNALERDGFVHEAEVPFTRLHFNACFAEIEALFQRAGYHRGLDVVGYQGKAYAMFDPGRWDPVLVLRRLKDQVEVAAVG
jgi:hypothetical protein